MQSDDCKRLLIAHPKGGEYMRNIFELTPGENKVANIIWKPIEPLLDSERKIDLAAISPLYETWQTAKERLKASSPENLKIFSSRLVRRLSIETGNICYFISPHWL